MMIKLCNFHKIWNKEQGIENSNLSKDGQSRRPSSLLNVGTQVPNTFKDTTLTYFFSFLISFFVSRYWGFDTLGSLGNWASLFQRFMGRLTSWKVKEKMKMASLIVKSCFHWAKDMARVLSNIVKNLQWPRYWYPRHDIWHPTDLCVKWGASWLYNRR